MNCNKKKEKYTDFETLNRCVIKENERALKEGLNSQVFRTLIFYVVPGITDVVLSQSFEHVFLFI